MLHHNANKTTMRFEMAGAKIELDYGAQIEIPDALVRLVAKRGMKLTPGASPHPNPPAARMKNSRQPAPVRMMALRRPVEAPESDPVGDALAALGVEDDEPAGGAEEVVPTGAVASAVSGAMAALGDAAAGLPGVVPQYAAKPRKRDDK